MRASTLTALPDGSETVASLRDAGAASGIYIYPDTPDPSDENAMKKWKEDYGGGPYISLLVYNQGGYLESMGTMFLGSFMLNIAGAGLVVCLLCLAGMRAQSYMRRVAFVSLLGIFASLVGPLMEWHMMGFSASFSIPVVLDGIIAWSLAGSVIAALVRANS